MKRSYIFIIALMIVYFFNQWIPSIQYYFNVVSPSLKTTNVDFYAYYLGGKAYLQGREPFNATKAVQPYIYPPTFIPIFGQIARLDFNSARFLWAGIYSLMFLFATGFLLHISEPQDRIPAFLMLVALALFSYPLTYLIRQGQIDLITSSLAFISVLLYIKKHLSLSAASLAFATLLKFNPVLLLATYVVFLRDWKFLLLYAMIVISLILISFIFFPPDWYRAFIIQVLPMLTKSSLNLYNQTPLRFFAGGRRLPELITIAGYGGLSAIAFWFGQLSKEKHPYQIFAFYLLNVATMLLVSGSAWIMAYTWFLLPVVPVLLYLMRHSSWLIIAVVSMAAFATQGIPREGFMIDSLNMIAAAICGLSMLWFLFKDMKRKPDLSEATRIDYAQ